ncbi:MAG: DNA polymerase III subunit gamma/tau [Pseudomonadales bacterium]|jgi:DNA polymerase-3 subunit gamma/tau|nr:DNA polymerase III subunit gamma/tau [Pseudomonadales bacterium]
MAYEVLARKWRPGSFATMVGQEHVLRALTHALESERLHHAYLFTGTRGVGKTTVARILARCLNCERGVTAEPCGTCGSCTEIAEGRFVDLIEVDAASRTKVEDTRELLDNVQYAPTRGRYKVYLIDEVHMLSTSSFNALLKTLEEPPPHVKFLLATTDPKKLPVTVLSRCLQFHLKNLTPERIVGHLEHVLGEEGVSFESGALWALARAADGSMRDALSLTDQAVAHGDGRLVADEVARMLGTIDQAALGRILAGLADGDGAALLACCEDLSTHAADFPAVLADLLSLLHRVAVAQAVPEAERPGLGDADAELVAAMAGRLAPEDVQLYYQIGLVGVRDLPFAPDPRTGFEMTLLRMLAFRPVDGEGGAPAPGAGRGRAEAPAAAARAAPAPDAGGPARAEAAATDAERPRPARRAPAEAAIPVTRAADTPVSRTQDASVAAVPGPEARVPEVPVPEVPRPDGPVPHARISEVPVAEAPPAASASEPRPAPAYPRPTTEDAPSAPAAADHAVADPAVADDASAHDAFGAEAPAGEVRDAAGDASSPAPAPPVARGAATGPVDAERWHALLPELALEGLTGELAAHCLPDPETAASDTLRLVLDPRAESLLADVHAGRLETALARVLGRTLRVRIEPGVPPGETPARRAERERDERQQRAVSAIENDAMVQALLATFDASLQRDSIRPRS